MRLFLNNFCLVTFLLALAFNTSANAEDRPAAEAYLVSGDLDGGERALEAALKDHPDDAQARFGLGMIQFVHGVERLVQSFYRHGLDLEGAGGAVPFARIPVPTNPNPKPISYEDLRAILQTMVDDLARSEQTLAQVKDKSVKLPIRFGLVRLDFDGDGKASDEETLWKIFARLNRLDGQPAGPAEKRAENENVNEEEAAFLIAFDYGDVAWLRGYSHLLSALLELYLAHDGKTLFEHTAHRFFVDPKTPFPNLKSQRGVDPGPAWNFARIADLVAFVHLQRYPLKEPKRMESVLRHLESMIQLSRESWTSYLAETDNDHEWIPNPKQTTVIPRTKVTEEMVKAWHDLLKEVELILQGKLLVPFWRGAEGQGVNLRKVFTEPRDLDVILWLQGTAAQPYLEAGSITTPDFWSRINRAFNGQFVGFALWFN